MRKSWIEMYVMFSQAWCKFCCQAGQRSRTKKSQRDFHENRMRRCGEKVNKYCNWLIDRFGFICKRSTADGAGICDARAYTHQSHSRCQFIRIYVNCQYIFFHVVVLFVDDVVDARRCRYLYQSRNDKYIPFVQNGNSIASLANEHSRKERITASDQPYKN